MTTKQTKNQARHVSLRHISHVGGQLLRIAGFRIIGSSDAEGLGQAICIFNCDMLVSEWTVRHVDGNVYRTPHR